MGDTEKAEQPQTNGLENGLDEDERSKLRPADIDADVKEMERRKRVEMIMSSKLFREELERIIELQLKDGNGPAGLLQQISDMMGIQSGKLHTTHMFRGSNCVTPINDIRGVESMGYEKGEKNLRCKLASVFRLMDLYGWSQGINNQITARLNQDEEHFLVNPHGMLFNEITASSLIKVDMQGNIVEPGTTNFSVNTQGFLLHSAIHASRPDVNCVIHIKTPSVLAVSSLKCGLLPICQEALVIGEVSQHPFVSGIFEPEEREKIIRNLGPHNKVLLLHNHGALCCGATVEEAFYNVYNTVLACETQMKLMPIGVENLLLVSDETRKQVYDAAHRAPDTGASGEKKKFRVGEMEFEALIRMLDNAGFRTGYIYRHPLVKGELPKPKNDVEVPPAVSSLGYLIEQEELYKQGNWKKYIDGRNRLDRTKWLNSPNVYQKVEILETGTSDPKKITKWVDQNSEEWVAESSPTHSSTPVKIESALQFVPKGTNPKEFKKLQQQIKENRRADKITSGPQSHILEGVSWEEAKKLQDANITQTGDQVILVGAASKGIIQRNYQHNALVYKTPYAKNPFDSMSDKEIEDYKQLVERKQRGDTDYEESQSESEAISSSRQDGLRQFKSPLLSPQSATSETEEESRDEPRVLRIETKTAPRPIQAEVVLSDAESDTTDVRVERSHSARYPKAEKPESVTLMNSFRKSWSLKKEKDKSKDTENIYDSRNLHQSLILKECEQDRMESLHCCVARLKQLTHKPVIVDVRSKILRPLLKYASDPCSLSSLKDQEETVLDSRPYGVFKESNTSLSCTNIMNTSELHRRLSVRKKLLHSAKMKFLGYYKNSPDGDKEIVDKTPTSPMRALISEIRETISEIVSPERSKISEDSEDHFKSMRWIQRPKFLSRNSESDINSKQNFEVMKSKSFSSFTATEVPPEPLSNNFSDFKNDFQALTLDVENSETFDTSNFNCTVTRNSFHERTLDEEKLELETAENRDEKNTTENILSETKFTSVSDEEATYTLTEDSLLQTYSFTESTGTEWYYNKTIMKLENSQTVLEIKETDKEENLAMPVVRYVDTGIDTDFTSEREIDVEVQPQVDELQEEAEVIEATEDLDGNVPVCESSNLNKSSETDSSFLKSSSGRTSNDVDSSFAFKTETENSEKVSDKSPEKSTNLNRIIGEKKTFLEQMLLKTIEPIEEESSDSGEANLGDISKEACKEKQTELKQSKLPDIIESPEFTNVDTEDAPITSSSKDTSPEAVGNMERLMEEKPINITKEPEADVEEEKENLKGEQKRKKNVKSSTKITVKKELKDKDSKDPFVSEIRLTIKNSNKCQSEKYEVKIQDVTNTSEELSRSVSSAGENADSYESFEIVEKSCDCEAQQNLEELQDEVSSTIEKLQTIEDYFEDEIKKHSNQSPEKRNQSDEFTIEYNYKEFEEVMNESRGKVMNSLKSSSQDLFCDLQLEGPNQENSAFIVSSALGDLCGEIKVCNDTYAPDAFIEEHPVCENEIPMVEASHLSIENDIDNIAVSSAFVAAILSEAVLEEGNHSVETSGKPEGEVLEVICNIEILSDVDHSEVTNEPKQDADHTEVTSEPKQDVDHTEVTSEPKQEVDHLEVTSESKQDVEKSMAELFLSIIDKLDLKKPLEVKATESQMEHQDCQLSKVNNVTELSHDDSKQPFQEDYSENSNTIVIVNGERNDVIHLRGPGESHDIINVVEEKAERNIPESEVASAKSLEELEKCTQIENGEQLKDNYNFEEFKSCQQSDVKNCVEVKVGYDEALVPEMTAENALTEYSSEHNRLANPVAEKGVFENHCPEYSSKGNMRLKNPNSEQPNGVIEEKSEDELKIADPIKLLFPTPLNLSIPESHKSKDLVEGKKLNPGPVEDILNYLLTSVIEKNKRNMASMNDVINFLTSNEESPVDSLAELEDIENIISTSSLAAPNQNSLDSTESQTEEVESLPDEEGTKYIDGMKMGRRKKKKEDDVFKVTIATASKKEIFINYSLDYSSTFNTSSDFDQLNELCNSYIKTDDVNEDFENMSSDNPDFYSVTSSGKNSLNSSFCSVESHAPVEQFCCLNCENNIIKSPRSLSIIQEVEEGDSSSSSEVVAPPNPN